MASEVWISPGSTIGLRPQEADLEAVREAGLGQELLGRGEVLLVGLEARVEAEGHRVDAWSRCGRRGR